MEATFACPQCNATALAPFEENSKELACSACKHVFEIPSDAVKDGHVRRCLVCPSTELYVRKDFPQQLGVTIIVLGFIASTVTWYYYWRYATYAILFATALLDFGLYFLMGNVLQCYRCHSQYRGLAGLDNHEPFDLETHEKYRQQKIRLAEAESHAASRS